MKNIKREYKTPILKEIGKITEITGTVGSCPNWQDKRCPCCGKPIPACNCPCKGNY